MGTGLAPGAGAGRDGAPGRAGCPAAVVGRSGSNPPTPFPSIWLGQIGEGGDTQGADDAMKFGFIPTEGGPYFQEALTEAVAGETLGFDSVWLEEHHGIRNHYWPSPLMALAGIATRTS